MGRAGWLAGCCGQGGVCEGWQAGKLGLLGGNGVAGGLLCSLTESCFPQALCTFSCDDASGCSVYVHSVNTWVAQ